MSMKLETKKIEKIFGRKTIPFISVLGVDTASRTGWCRATTDPENILLEYGFIDVKTPERHQKYDQYLNAFGSLIHDEDIVIIEESFYGKNVKTFQLLSRLGAFIYALAYLKGIKDKQFMLATTARRILGFKGNLKKEIIQQQFSEKVHLTTDDNDIIDAIILAFCGILEPMQLVEKQKIKKVKKIKDEFRRKKNIVF